MKQYLTNFILSTLVFISMLLYAFSFNHSEYIFIYCKKEVYVRFYIYDGIETKKKTRTKLYCIFTPVLFAKIMHKILINFLIFYIKDQKYVFLLLNHTLCVRAQGLLCLFVWTKSLKL